MEMQGSEGGPGEIMER
jgi:hypothetical protein